MKYSSLPVVVELDYLDRSIFERDKKVIKARMNITGRLKVIVCAHIIKGMP